MGAGASLIVGEAKPLDSLSAEDVGNLVAAIGPAFVEYKVIMINEGINGVFLAELEDAQLAETLNDIGITKAVHVKNISAQFKALKNKANQGHNKSNSNSSGNAVVSNVAGILEKVATVVHGLDLPTRVSVTPRKLMSDLFAIQGIALDPSDLDPAIDKIVATVGSSGGICDGDKSFDVFVNYRVAADADVAEKLYLYLKTKGINAFLDKKCLKAGEPWKEGFLSGLSRSRLFLCLISSPALANVRDKTKNHERDNVLLEYETALLIQRHLAEVDADLARAYIVPVHVGQFSQGVLTKFTDFDATMYPDSVGPESDHSNSNVDTASNITTPTAVVMDLTTCEGTIAALHIPSLGPAEAEAALKAIGNLCRLDWENGDTLDKLGACELILKVLLTYATTNAFVAVQGCYAVHSLSKGGDGRKEGGDSRKDKFVASGAVEVLIKSLQSFPTNPDVALNGWWAIMNLTVRSNDRKNKIVASGAIDEVIKVLRAFSTNVEIVKVGCKTISFLSNGRDDICDKLVAAGAIEEVINALRAFPEDPEFVQRVCSSICNFATRSDNICDKLVAAGAVDEIINALRAFPGDAEVVKQGCAAILYISYGSDDRKDTIVAAGAKPLLEAALNNETLTQKARDKAEEALDRLD